MTEIVITKVLNSVPEGSKAGTVLATVSTFPEQAGVTYTVQSELYGDHGSTLQDNSFSISGNQILIAGKFDYERMEALELHILIRVSAHLDGQILDTKGILYDVSDVMEDISGTPGNDTLSGSFGMDKLLGGAGNDKLIAFDGNDILYGGMGKDYLSGGQGADTFLFKSIKESTATAFDVITDWEHAPKGGIRDHVDLSQIDANAKVAGDQGFDWIGTKKFTGHAGELRYEKHGSYSMVYADVNGDKKVDFAIKYDDAVTLYKDDFLL